MRLAVSAALLLSMLWPPGDASAHLGLDAPTSRYGPDTLKTGPCGVDGGERTNNVTYFEPGETIDVVWNEYVEHPGHYRIAFDPDGDDDFVDPATMMDLYSNEAVLLDGIPDQSRDNRNYLATVTLPDIECDKCTLQVIQVMYDKPPYTTPGNDIYYQCADLVLRAGGPPDGGVGTGGSDTGGSDTGGSGAGGSGAGGSGVAAGDSSGCSASSTQDVSWLALLLILLLARRLARASRLPV
jgi:hypothetical protein